MATARTIMWIDRLIWTLIFGGGFTVVLGIATRPQDGVTGWSLIAVGAVVAAVGAVLVWVRSRLDETADTPQT